MYYTIGYIKVFTPLSIHYACYIVTGIFYSHYDGLGLGQVFYSVWSVCYMSVFKSRSMLVRMSLVCWVTLPKPVCDRLSLVSCEFLHW